MKLSGVNLAPRPTHRSVTTRLFGKCCTPIPREEAGVRLLREPVTVWASLSGPPQTARHSVFKDRPKPASACTGRSRHASPGGATFFGQQLTQRPKGAHLR